MYMYYHGSRPIIMLRLLGDWNAICFGIRWVQFGDVFLIKIFPSWWFFITFNIPPKKFPSHDFPRLTLGIWWAMVSFRMAGFTWPAGRPAVRPPTHDQSIWHEIKNTPASCQRSRNKTNCPSLVHNVHTIEMNSLITKTCCSFMCKLTLILFISNNEWIVQPASAFIFSSRHFVLKEC